MRCPTAIICRSKKGPRGCHNCHTQKSSRHPRPIQPDTTECGSHGKEHGDKTKHLPAHKTATEIFPFTLDIPYICRLGLLSHREHPIPRAGKCLLILENGLWWREWCHPHLELRKS